MLDARGFDVAHMLGIDALVFADDDITGFVGDIKSRDFPAQTLSDKLHFSALRAQAEVIKDKEVRQNLLSRHSNGLEQDRDWHLAATVDTEVQNIFRVELEIQP